MKLAMLAPANSIHTQRWANEIALRGHQVDLLSSEERAPGYEPSVGFHSLPFRRPWGYYLNALFVRRQLERLRPDLLHAHYASGYGTLARLSRFRPYLLSVWGSDVYLFPSQSRLKHRLIVKNLRWADQIASTSAAMKRQTEKLLKPAREIRVTPFGVDCAKFSPVARPRRSAVVLGTVKALAPIYGIDTLIRTFRAVVDQGWTDVRLLIVGGGPQERELKDLAVSLGVHDKVEFVGSVPHDQVPRRLSELDIYYALSTSESFGVAVLEASACGVPVIVSDVGGLPEVVRDGETGYVVPAGDVAAATERTIRLLRDPGRRRRMGVAGREHVLAEYEWRRSADKMEEIYVDLVSRRPAGDADPMAAGRRGQPSRGGSMHRM